MTVKLNGNILWTIKTRKSCRCNLVWLVLLPWSFMFSVVHLMCAEQMSDCHLLLLVTLALICFSSYLKGPSDHSCVGKSLVMFSVKRSSYKAGHFWGAFASRLKFQLGNNVLVLNFSILRSTILILYRIGRSHSPALELNLIIASHGSGPVMHFSCSLSQLQSEPGSIWYEHVLHISEGWMLMDFDFMWLFRNPLVTKVSKAFQ